MTPTRAGGPTAHLSFRAGVSWCYPSLRKRVVMADKWCSLCHILRHSSFIPPHVDILLFLTHIKLTYILFPSGQKLFSPPEKFDWTTDFKQSREIKARRVPQKDHCKF